MAILKKWNIVCLAFLALSLIYSPPVKAQRDDYTSFQIFYDDLAPYGRWVNDPYYGYIWIPDEGPGFQPYASRGYWVVTQYGNTWVSDYPWGWAPFHYGRWGYDSFYGWFWVPGDEWGPAWVSWRSGGDYYGWAPLPPGVSLSVSINIPLSRWIFVQGRYITSPRIYNYYVPGNRVRTIYNNTYIINNYYERNNRRYVYGPRPNDIERVTRGKVRIHNIDNSGRPGRAEVSNNSVRIYRPDVRRDERNAPRPRVDNNNAQGNQNRRENPTVNRPVRPEEERNTRGNQAERERPSRSEANRGNEENRKQSRGNNTEERRPERERPSRNDNSNRNQNIRGSERERESRPGNSERRSEPQKRESSGHESNRGRGRPERG